MVPHSPNDKLPGGGEKMKTLEEMHGIAEKIIALAQAAMKETDPRVCRGLLSAILGKTTEFI